jgi:CheY-like chemotaxis protein
MMELLERSLGPAINIKTVFPPEAVLARTDANQLETALLNLAINGRDAMPDGGTLGISVSVKETDGKFACLSVSDTGFGMDEATLARATEPFFTTKGIGKGTGLGLSMVDGLVGQSGGKLMARSTPGQGTTIELWFPIATVDTVKRNEADLEERADTSSTKRPLCILVVDDDNLVLANVTAMLEELGHHVIGVSSGTMPGMTGLQLIEQIRIQRRTLPVILATGFAELPRNVDPSIGRLGKPFTQRALAEAVASSLAR